MRGSFLSERLSIFFSIPGRFVTSPGLLVRWCDEPEPAAHHDAQTQNTHAPTHNTTTNEDEQRKTNTHIHTNERNERHTQYSGTFRRKDP